MARIIIVRAKLVRQMDEFDTGRDHRNLKDSSLFEYMTPARKVLRQKCQKKSEIHNFKIMSGNSQVQNF